MLQIVPSFKKNEIIETINNELGLSLAHKDVRFIHSGAQALVAEARGAKSSENLIVKILKPYPELPRDMAMKLFAREPKIIDALDGNISANVPSIRFVSDTYALYAMDKIPGHELTKDLRCAFGYPLFPCCPVDKETTEQLALFAVEFDTVLGSKGIISKNEEALFEKHLFKHLETKNRDNLSDLKTIFTRINTATKRLKENGVSSRYTHGDLKPANIFLDRKNGQVKLGILDFGLASYHHPIFDMGILAVRFGPAFARNYLKSLKKQNPSWLPVSYQDLSPATSLFLYWIKAYKERKPIYKLFSKIAAAHFALDERLAYPQISKIYSRGPCVPSKELH